MLIALLAPLLLASIAAPDDYPWRQLVLCVAARAFPTHLALGPYRSHARAARGIALAAYLAPLGLQVIGALSDCLPRRDEPASIRGPLAYAAPNPFDLDPERVWLVQAPDSVSARAEAQRLARDSMIEWVELNQVRASALERLDAIAPPALLRPSSGDRLVGLDPSFPDDPMFRDSRQWGLRNLGESGVYGGLRGADIHALEAWEHSTGSNHVRLAVADTGVDPSHPDLAAAVPGGGARIELGLDVTEPSTNVRDGYGHGTPVTGVMAALSGEGSHFDSLGVAGVCGGDGGANLGCRIVPIKITPGDEGYTTSFAIARAAVYAASVGARAMNLSFAGSGSSRLEREALYYAVTRGCVVVAASGNRGAVAGGTQAQYPAAYAEHGLCIQVGASDPWDHRAPFSSHGPGLDLLAPGIDVWTTFMTYPSRAGAVYNGYVAASGTSFAAPFATGTVGLLAAARPELSDCDFQRLLCESADDVGPPGVDGETGFGRLNAGAALAALRPGLGIWHDEVRADRFVVGPSDTLVVGESGPGLMDGFRSWPNTHRIEALATVVLPDSFLDSVRVWPRVGGTMTVRGDFQLPYFVPWAEVASVGRDCFTLRGYMYQVANEVAGEPDAYLPLPLDQARFGFTVIGRVARAPSRQEEPLAERAQATASPNPFRGSTVFRPLARGWLGIWDVSGRRVRRVLVDDSVTGFTWDGRDDRGVNLPPGLYFVRSGGAARGRPLKVLKIE